MLLCWSVKNNCTMLNVHNMHTTLKQEHLPKSGGTHSDSTVEN